MRAKQYTDTHKHILYKNSPITSKCFALRILLCLSFSSVYLCCCCCCFVVSWALDFTIPRKSRVQCVFSLSFYRISVLLHAQYSCLWAFFFVREIDVFYFVVSRYWIKPIWTTFVICLLSLCSPPPCTFLILSISGAFLSLLLSSIHTFYLLQNQWNFCCNFALKPL